MFNFINKIKNRKGFTLVELLVVLAVLAIISAIAIPRFAGVQASAKEKADKETINMVQKALELWLVSEDIANPDPAESLITLTKEASGTKVEYGAGYAATNFADYIELGKLKLQHYTSLTFTLETNGKITSATN